MGAKNNTPVAHVTKSNSTATSLVKKGLNHDIKVISICRAQRQSKYNWSEYERMFKNIGWRTPLPHSFAEAAKNKQLYRIIRCMDKQKINPAQIRDKQTFIKKLNNIYINNKQFINKNLNVRRNSKEAQMQLNVHKLNSQSTVKRNYLQNQHVKSRNRNVNNEMNREANFQKNR
eukprot:732206_1